MQKFYTLFRQIGCRISSLDELSCSENFQKEGFDILESETAVEGADVEQIVGLIAVQVIFRRI